MIFIHLHIPSLHGVGPMKGTKPRILTVLTLHHEKEQRVFKGYPKRKFLTFTGRARASTTSFGSGTGLWENVCRDQRLEPPNALSVRTTANLIKRLE